jgi:membrane protease YdiL (CAAX protease family)
MLKLKSLATNRPIVFGITITALSIMLLIVLLVLTAIPVLVLESAGERISFAIAGLGRLLIAALFIFLLYRLGWLHAAGFRGPDFPRKWAVIVLSTLYLCLALPYAYTRSLAIDLSDPSIIAIGFLKTLAVGLLEETVFRGVIMYAFLRLWGDSPQGVLKSLLISSLLFSSIHLFNFLSGVPFVYVLLQTVYTLFLGIFVAAVVLYTKSIWPAIVFHTLIDAASQLGRIGKPELDPTLSLALLLAAIILPVGAYGLYLLRRVETGAVVPEAA